MKEKSEYDWPHDQRVLNEGNTLSRMMYCSWLPLINATNKRPFETKDFRKLPPFLRYSENLQKFRPFYEKRKEKKSLVGITVAWAIHNYVWVFVLQILADSGKLVIPFIIRGFIGWFDGYLTDPVETGIFLFLKLPCF